jgi:hypothetical protein
MRTSALPYSQHYGNQERYFETCGVSLLYFSLGDFVTHPDRPDWGMGQVQSIVGTNVTVNFEHAGKQMINCQIITLIKVAGLQRI